MTPTEELAALVLQLLDMQGEYFRTRQQDLLQQCKRAERHLKRRCEEILRPPAPPAPTLFDNPTTQKPTH